MKYQLDLGILQNLSHELPTFYNIKDRFQHCYILGKTGMGKSVLMERLAHYDLQNDLSVIYIDPKGDSVKRLYHLNQDKNIRYISIDQPIVINPLNKQGYPQEVLIKEFINVLDTLITLTSINPESSVRMKELITMAIKSFQDRDIRIDFLTDFLNYEDIRKSYKFKANQDYWQEFDAKQGQYYKNRYHHDTAKSITSRLFQFINDERMKRFILGENELYIEQMLEENGSLLVDTSAMGKDERIYISNLIIHAVASYIQYKRVGKPLLVYVDEFQSCASDLFSEILQYGRTAQVGFVLAHHDFLQIKKEILSSIFGIVDNFIIFRCGDEEASRISNILGIKAKELMDLKKYNAWVRLGTDNTLIETFKPLMEEVPEIDTPHSPAPAFTNFLKNAWINCYNDNRAT